MHTTSLIKVVFVPLATAWCTVALADLSVMQGRALLTKRQASGGSQAFKPVPETGYGTTCEQTFGAGYIQCAIYQGRPNCYNPGDGDSCCREGYTCPGGNFCLTQGYCCPEGLSPESCAIQQSVTLPSGFKTDAVTPSASSSTSSFVEPTSVEPTSAQATSDVSAPTTINTSYGTGIPRPTSSLNGTYNPSVVPEPFTGAGYALKSAASGAIAAVVGLVGLMGYLF